MAASRPEIGLALSLALASCESEPLTVPREVGARAGFAGERGPGDYRAPKRGDPEEASGVALPAPQRTMRVFITRAQWDGNLLLAAQRAGARVTTGRDGADALCTSAATAAGLGGRWVAWISDSAVDAIDRLEDVGPWYDLFGAKVFESKAALSGDPLVALTIDERGGTTDYAAWTGTHADGTRAAQTCGDWASSSRSYGLCGVNNTTSGQRWSEDIVPRCNNPYNLYCFEQ